MSELNFIDLNNAATSSLRSERGEHLASGRGRYKKMNAKPSDQDRVKCFVIQIMRFSKDCNYSLNNFGHKIEFARNYSLQNGNCAVQYNMKPVL